MLSISRKAPFTVNVSAPLLLGASLFVFFILLYWQTSSNLVALWNTNNTYSHGFLVLILSMWLVYRNNSKLLTLSITPAPLLLIPLIGSLVLWLFASITDTKTIELTLLPLIFIMAYSSIIGFKIAYLLAPSLLYLLLATPIWEVFVPLFQLMAVTVNEFALQVSGIPTYIKDTTVTIPAGVFEIKGGCSGIRFLLVTLALGLYVSISNFKSLKLSIVLVTASVILPVIFNWARIYILILIGHLSNMESSLMKDHEMFGWYLYAVSLIPWFLLVRWLSNKEQEEDIEESNNTIKATYPKLFISIVIILIASAPAFIFYFKNTELNTLTSINTVKASMPWLGPIQTNSWKPDYRGATLELNQLYIGSENNSDISLHINYYGRQSQGKELINELNNITESDNITHKRNIAFNSHQIIELTFEKDKTKRLVWYWFQVDNKATTKPIIVKLLQFKELTTGRSRSSLIALSAVCALDCTNEKSSLKRFLKKHYKDIIRSAS